MQIRPYPQTNAHSCASAAKYMRPVPSDIFNIVHVGQLLVCLIATAWQQSVTNVEAVHFRLYLYCVHFTSTSTYYIRFTGEVSLDICLCLGT